MTHLVRWTLLSGVKDGVEDVYLTHVCIVIVHAYIVEVRMRRKPKPEPEPINLPLNSKDVKHAERQINQLFNGVVAKELFVEGIPIEKFSREYLVKLLYITGEQFMETTNG